MELNSLFRYLLASSLFANVLLIVFYIIMGPRKPRTQKEIEKSMLDISEALNYKFVVISLDKNKSISEGIDFYGFCAPEKVPVLQDIFFPAQDTGLNTLPEVQNMPYKPKNEPIQ